MAAKNTKNAVLWIIALIASILLSACTVGAPSTTARPLAVVEGEVAKIPGVGFTAGRAWDGTTPYLEATLSATDDFTGDPARLINYALAQLASQDEVDRGRFVRFTFEGPGQTVEGTQKILASLGIESQVYGGGSSLELSSKDLEQRYGTWPAPVPEAPAG